MKRGTIDHPKTLMLADLLNIHLLTAAGLLEALWHWTASRTPRGDVGRYPNVIIARGCHWDGDADAMVSAMVECGWLDECEAHRLVVHDWSEHADEAVKKKLARAGDAFADGVEPPSSAREADRNPPPAKKKPPSRRRRDNGETRLASVEKASRPPEPEPVPNTLSIESAAAGPPNRAPSASEVYREVCRLNPRPAQREAIEAVVTDIDRWRDACRNWVLRGYKPTNVDGMLEWYRDGIPPARPSPSGGKRAGPVVSDAEQERLREKYSDEDADVVNRRTRERLQAKLAAKNTENAEVAR